MTELAGDPIILPSIITHRKEPHTRSHTHLKEGTSPLPLHCCFSTSSFFCFPRKSSDPNINPSTSHRSISCPVYPSLKHSFRHAAHLSVHPLSPVSPGSPMMPVIWQIGEWEVGTDLTLRRYMFHLFVLNLVSSSLVLQSSFSVIKKVQPFQMKEKGKELNS